VRFLSLRTRLSPELAQRRVGVCGHRQREFRTEPALPDAGLTGDHREHGMVGGPLEYADERGELVVTADEGPAEMTCGR
jgi:hypothetical protein